MNEYKVSSMCYDVVSETAPPYLSLLLHLYIPSRSLRSSADTRTFRIPKRKKTFQGQRTFSHLGPVSWNNLPYSVCYAAKFQFKTQLKTTLFLSAHGPNKLFPLSIDPPPPTPTPTNPLIVDLLVSMRTCCTCACLRVCVCVCVFILVW